MTTLSHHLLPNRHVAIRDGVGISSHLLQANSLVHADVAIDLPSFIFVVSGRKCLKWAKGSLTAEEGSILVVPGGTVVEVNNDPVGRDRYEAFSVILDMALIPAPLLPLRRLCEPRMFPQADASFVDALCRAREAIVESATLPDAVAHHRVLELARWSEAAGFHLLMNTKPTIAMKIRSIVKRDISRSWTARELAAHLAMSEQTMRRRLANEATSFTQVLADLRLSHALLLLQSTDESIAQIALSIGYESPSSFAAKFRQRFGHSPNLLRQSAAESRAVA